MSEVQQDEKKCPLCAEVIKQDALKCKHCQSEIAAIIDPDVKPTTSDGVKQSEESIPAERVVPSKQPVPGKPTLAKAYAIGMIAIQLTILGGFYFATPGYLVPFLNDSGAQVVLLVLVVWQLLGLVLISLSQYKRWKTILICAFATAPLSLALIFGPAIGTIINALGPIMGNADSKGSVQTTDNSAAASNQDITLNASIRIPSMTFQINRAVLKKSFSASWANFAAAPDATYLVVYYSARNDGTVPVSLSPDGIVVSTKDGTTFEPDGQASYRLRRDEGMDSHLQLQPGIQKESAVVFEIPLGQLKNDPSIYISRNTWAGKVPLFPNQDQIQKIESPPRASDTPEKPQTVTTTDAAPKPDQPKAVEQEEATLQSPSTEAQSSKPEPRQAPGVEQPVQQLIEPSRKTEEIERLRSELTRIHQNIKENSDVMERKKDDGVTGGQLEKDAIQKLRQREQSILSELEKLGVDKNENNPSADTADSGF